MGSARAEVIRARAEVISVWLIFLIYWMWMK